MDIEPIIQEYRSLRLHEVLDHDRFNQYAIVHHSSGIEGSTLTENETRLLLEEGVTPKGKPLEHSLMVKDHFAALQFTLAAARNKEPITIGFIQSIAARVMHSTGSIYENVLGRMDATKGEFRNENVSAGGSYFIGYDKVVRYVERLVEDLNAELAQAQTMGSQLLLSFRAHFDLVSIHPFFDGNGRTSRLLMNYIQEYFQSPLAIVYQEYKNDYFDALAAARKTEKIQVFYDFMEGQYRKFLQSEIDQYRNDFSRELTDKEKEIRGSGGSIFF